MPAGKTEGPFPTVILPHGGPTERDYFTFDWLVQFLATRGYAVLQPQFRGSTGFGDAFREAGDRQWGGLMQDDITDGVHAMIDQKIADPHGPDPICRRWSRRRQRDVLVLQPLIWCRGLGWCGWRIFI